MSPDDLASVFRAGFGDGFGTIGQPALDQGGWWAPRSVHVTEGRLHWDDGAMRLPDGSRQWEAGSGRMVHVEPDMLGQFIETADDETGDRISDFASTFGVLQLCDRRLPVGHSRPGIYSEAEHADCCPTGWSSGEAYIDLDAWRLWAQCATALVTIAAKLQMAELPAREHWAAAYAPSMHAGHVLRQTLSWRETLSDDDTLALERHTAAALVNEWLALGDIRLEATWTREASRPTARAAGRGLFGALALQLLLTTAKSEGLAICSSCGLPYAPKRKPPTGRDHYCPSCGKQAARREASRRWRAKKRAERSDSEGEG